MKVRTQHAMIASNARLYFVVLNFSWDLRHNKASLTKFRVSLFIVAWNRT